MGRRSRILFLSFTIVALVVTLILVAGCGTEESADLDPTKIAEYNKPGTVLVETVWTADVSFPELAIDYDALETAFINAVRDGTVSPDATTEEIATVLITELATFPELYLYATTEDRVTTMEASVYGSGFIVSDDGYVVTNAHIVKKSDEALAATMAEENAGELLQEDLAKFEEELGIDLPAEYEDYFLAAAADIYATYYTVSSPASDTSMYMVSVGDESISDAIPAEVVEVGDPMDIQEETGKDVAVLKVNKTNLPTVAMGDDKELMDGDQVLALGYPGTATFDYVLDINAELSPTLTQGTVSAKKTVSGGWEVIQSDAYTTNGSSGSPLLNMKGEAIGVNTFGAGDVNESTGEFEASPGFNFAIPATVINEFLNQANVEPAIGSLTDTYREAIDLYMDKHYSAAKEKFQEIYDANSDFPYVQ
ncbi:MAG TPA: trypsin-like serine protease, partial [Actinobacteria bacterium]|nr:trypsin-like serine protease [Actinomycetota bacterium]